MKYIGAIITAMVLMTSCSNSTKNEDSTQYPELSVSGSGNSIEGLASGVSALPRMGFGGLTYFNSSKSSKRATDRPDGVIDGLVDIDSVVIEGNEIMLNGKSGWMSYKISFPDSYESIGEDSYGWRFNVARKDTAFADLSEIRIYEEDKDGLPYFAFVDKNGQWITWDILRWQDMPKRKIMANHPSDEEVASFQEKKLGEDFVGL